MFPKFSLFLTREFLVGLGLGIFLLLSLSSESRFLLRQDCRVGGTHADTLVFLPVGTLALLAAVSSRHTLAKTEVADDGANLAPGWFPVEHLLEHGSLEGSRGSRVAMGNVDGGA